MGEKGEGSGGERGRELGMGYPPVHPSFNISIEANIVDPDQTAPRGAVCSGSTLFVYEASRHKTHIL